MLEVGGLFGVLLLVANIYAIFKIFESNVSTGKKAIWTVAILLLPIIGFIAWLLFGPTSKKSIA